jgi:hypothetical protein
MSTQTELAPEATTASPNGDLQRMTDHHKALSDLAQECDRRLTVWACAKENARAARKAYEAATERLIGLAKEHIGPELPMFSANGQAEDESLKTPLSEVFETAGLSESITAKFRANGQVTIGDLAKWTSAPDPDPNQLTDIPGIGPAKAKQVEDALEAFWAKRNAAAVSEPVDGGEDEEEPE